MARIFLKDFPKGQAVGRSRTYHVNICVDFKFYEFVTLAPSLLARMPRTEFLPSRSSLLRTARNFLKELPRNKDGEDFPKGTSLRKGGEGWRGSSLREGRTRYISKVATDLPCWPFYLHKFVFNCIIYFLIVLIQ